MTSESETLSPLIGNIYDAALGQIGWSGVLQKICGFVGAVGADISSQNSTATDVIGYREFNIAREQTQPYFDKYTQLYFDKYVALNPINPVLPLLEVEKVYSLSDLLPYNEFYGTRFYKEWLGPQGVVDFFLASLEKSGTRTAFLTLRRNADNGLVNDDARRRMALVIPHVRRAMVIGKVIDFRKAEAAALTDTFAGLAAGIFLVDAKGRIVFCNDAGQSVLNEGKLIRSVRDTLVAIDPDADRALREVFALAGGGDAAIGTKGIAIPLRTLDDESFVVHALPLTSGARQQAGVTYSAAAAVFVRQAAPDTIPPMEAIASLYKLTMSECRVLHAVVTIGGVPAVADAFGISEATIKTHLHRVFAKTGLKRQADLANLVARHASPFLG